jgi:DNA polymerase I-like protein with 3'-5' exonuclease and polymerase domains
MLYETEVERAPGRDLWYSYGGKPRKIYGAACLENIVQFLARIVQMNAALRLAQRGLRMVHTVHDELVFIVPKKDVDETKRIVLEEMVRRPSWAPTLPLKAEVGSGLSYGESK